MKSLWSALKMYSRIPCPQVEWRAENRRYALCFFPLVGAVIGILFVLWYAVCRYLQIGFLLQGAGMMLLPLAVTGGFHMDGYCDVYDALSSCAPREKKLEILKDPHIGSFAVIHAAAYLILQTALYAQLKSLQAASVAGCGFILSRALSGLCAILFPATGKEGSLQDFTVPAHRRLTVIVLSAAASFCAAGMLFLQPFAGSFSLAAAALCVAHYKTVCLREFGGITGDCAGWFLQNCELAVAAACAAASVLNEI